MTISIDLSTVPLSATTISTAGTVRWMSPELLFGQNSPPTRESDCYALGMVIYEVSLMYSSLRPFFYPSPGSDRPPTVLSSRSLRSGDRCAGWGASKETRLSQDFGFLWNAVGVDVHVLERITLFSTNCSRPPSLPSRCLSDLGASSPVSHPQRP